MRRLLLLPCILLCFCCTREGADAYSVPGEAEEESVGNSCIPGEIIVRFSEAMADRIEQDLAAGSFMHTRSTELNSVLASLGATSVERLCSDGGKFEARHRQAGLHTWYKVKFDSTLPLTRASGDISRIPGVEYVCPERRIVRTSVFNDPRLPEQWNYISDGGGINVEEVWNYRSCGRPEVIVAVIDGGIQLDHEDLAGVVIPPGKDGSKNFVDYNFNIIAHDHGTHVAGTIGAINNNGKGVCGIAGGRDGNGGVRLLSCQVFKEKEDGKDESGNIFDALVWATDHGAVIANNSWSYVYDNEEEAKSGNVGYMGPAIEYFNNYAGIDENGLQVGPMRGGLVVFAAGNEGWTIGWPAAYDGVVSVGALGPGNQRSSYTNYGDWVDICAPGGDGNYPAVKILSSVPDNEYGYMEGTSMACPHVSGAAALVVSECGGPGFTREMLLEKLLKGADYGTSTVNAGVGPTLDVLGAVTYGTTKAPEQVESFYVTPHSNFIDFRWTGVTDPDDVLPYGYVLMASENASSLEGIDFSNVPEDVIFQRLKRGNPKQGNILIGTLPGLGFEKHYYATVVAYDYGGNHSAPAMLKEADTGANTPPVISTRFTGELLLKAHEREEIVFRVMDPDGHAVKTSFQSGSPACSGHMQKDGSFLMTFIGQDDYPGSYSATLTAVDEFGAKTEFLMPFTIQENHAPVVVKTIDNMILKPDETLTFALGDCIKDPDGEEPAYSFAVSRPDVAIVSMDGSELRLKAGKKGLASVTVTASDIKELKATMTFRVNVRDDDSPAEVYPTQVTDVIYVSDGASKELDISISNASGAVLYKESHVCDAFNPAVINMGGWAPGRYSVIVVSEGRKSVTNIVKL